MWTVEEIKRAVGPMIVVFAGVAAPFTYALWVADLQESTGIDWRYISAGFFAVFVVGLYVTLLRFQSDLGKIGAVVDAHGEELADLSSGPPPAGPAEPDGRPASRIQNVHALHAEADWATGKLLNAPWPGSLHILDYAKDEWMKRVLDLMEAAGCTIGEMRAFRTLDTYPVVGLGGDNIEHMNFKEQMAERIKRLRQAADAVEQRMMDG